MQPLVALSSTKAEYVAVTDAFKEAIWLQGLLNEIQVIQAKVVIFSDSQGAIHLCKNHVYHEITKHVDVKFHFVRDQMANGIGNIQKVPTNTTQLIWEPKLLQWPSSNTVWTCSTLELVEGPNQLE